MTSAYYVIEFRSGSFFRDLEAERGGSIADARRFASRAEAERFMDQHEWIYFNGGMAKEVAVPDETATQLIESTVVEKTASGSELTTFQLTTEGRRALTVESGPSTRDPVGHHLTEAIRHLSAAAEFMRAVAGREDSSDLAHLALVVDGAVETIRDVRGEVEGPKAVKDVETVRLVAELEALPSYRGWSFAYEYPGLFCFHQADGGPISVFFTPDWSGDQELQVEVQTEDGECLACEVLPLPREGRTGQKIFEIVRPTLDKLSAAHPEARQS